MNRLVLGIVVLTIAGSTFPQEPALAWGGAQEEPLWTQINVDSDGRVLTASGMERAGVRLALATEHASVGGTSTSRTTYMRGAEVLRIEKANRHELGLDLTYSAGEETLGVSLTIDDLTGETLVLYRLPDGEVFTFSFDAQGEIQSGDTDALRRALRRPMAVTRLLRSYVGNTKPFKNMLPSAAEGLIMLEIICYHDCAAGCGRQCSFECTLGATGCQVCWTACRIGCAIACN